MSAPLVVTLELDPQAQARFEALRREHFPPDRLVVGAHLTLFHALPGEHEADVLAEARAAAAVTAPLALRVSRVLLLGRGVAFRVEGDGLTALRARLAAAWAPWLSRQDAAPHRPHVTVQNKVEPAVARRLHAELEAGFAPHAARGEALRVWRYLGGPWAPVERVALRG